MDEPFPIGMMDCIRKFFATEDTRDPGFDVYQDVFDTELFFPLQRQAELALMMQEARKINPVTVMEIGSDKGGGLYHWCKSLHSVTQVIACEIRGTPYASMFEDSFPNITFNWQPKGSIDAVLDVRDWLGIDKIDCLFIDGDKGKFVEDFDAYLPLMNPNGIVFMHDINDREPTLAFEKVICRGYRHKRIIDTSDYRRETIKPSNTPHGGWLRHWRGRSCGVGVIYLGDKT